MNLDLGIGLNEALKKEFLMNKCCKKGAFSYMEMQIRTH